MAADSGNLGLTTREDTEMANEETASKCAHSSRKEAAAPQTLLHPHKAGPTQSRASQVEWTGECFVLTVEGREPAETGLHVRKESSFPLHFSDPHLPSPSFGMN